MLRPGALCVVASLATLVVSLSACDKSPPANAGSPAAAKPDAEPDAASEDGAPPASPDGTASSSILTLGDAKIMREGHRDRAIVLSADGKVSLAGKPFAVLHADGRLQDPQGTPMMTVNGDGTVDGQEGPTGVELNATGGAYQSEGLHLKLEFGADGKIALDASGPNAGLLGSGPGLMSEGCAGPMTQTCALITLNYLMALGNPDSVPEE